MLNKRLLIKNLLAHNDENSFYDKKLRLDLGSQEGKAKFLKHVCSLSNTNPENNAYLVIGVRDDDNEILGVDFFDDSKIQNLVNAYLENPPLIAYENIPFPHLKDKKVVGLVSIRPKNDFSICSLRKNIWKYYGGTVFMREGSISKPKAFDIEIKSFNKNFVDSIEKHSNNTIKYTLDNVFDFMKKNQNYQPNYEVFKEYFVLCWAGKRKKTKDRNFYSRVNIELINEQVKLFYSDYDEVEIEIGKNYFKILEYVHLGLERDFKYYPLEKVRIDFTNNMAYEITSEVVFKAPKFDKKTLFHFYNINNSLFEKMKNNEKLVTHELNHLLNLPSLYLICYLNDFEDALTQLEEVKPFLKKYSPEAYQRQKEKMRILRKLRYN
ncbi:ATP-binding protein [Psychroflexus maritimus]|uniref:ATP-binding protein n=1 Tax=Psychroflexus maritimus TaxID=2714865 RepID=A0A967AG47_9FLAO|nr:ATP-binding protein [Psychroflexus maritimus]NGZ88815.1 ATP-binding protein [Psychroflexus maritimus]